MANSNVFKVPAASLTTASVVLQTAGHAAITYPANYYFMGCGGNINLERQVEIFDGWEWLCTLAMADMDTPEFPRPAAAPGITAFEVEMTPTNTIWGVKHAAVLVNHATISDPFGAAGDNFIFFGLTGNTPSPVNYGAAMGSHGLRIAFETMKKFALTPEGKIWT
jgi:hypothetical protein